jgi:hypothetical protein
MPGKILLFCTKVAKGPAFTELEDKDAACHSARAVAVPAPVSNRPPVTVAKELYRGKTITTIDFFDKVCYTGVR